MLNVFKEQQGLALVVRLVGEMDEKSDLNLLIGPPPMELVLNTSQVTRINSNGVKNWIAYLEAAKAKGTRVKLVECSVPIVHQINFIKNFASSTTVESIFVPFACTKCKKDLAGLFTTEALRKANFKLPDLSCPDCKSPVEFDDVPEEYFVFLQRQ